MIVIACWSTKYSLHVVTCNFHKRFLKDILCEYTPENVNNQQAFRREPTLGGGGNFVSPVSLGFCRLWMHEERPYQRNIFKHDQKRFLSGYLSLPFNMNGCHGRSLHREKTAHTEHPKSSRSILGLLISEDNELLRIAIAISFAHLLT